MDERNIDQVVGELNRYKVHVAALQETKWFGSGVYEVGESVVLAAGRHVPGDGVVKQRGKGVAVVLSGVAVSAWKDAGKCWKAWSLRLISVKLKVARGNRDKCLYMCSVVTHQLMQLVERRRMLSMVCYNRLCLLCLVTHLTCCLEFPGNVVMIHGGMRECHMDLGS